MTNEYATCLLGDGYFRSKADDITEKRIPMIMKFRGVSEAEAKTIAWNDINELLASREGTLYGESNA